MEKQQKWHFNRKIKFDNKGNFSSRQEYKYDTKGNLTECTYYNLNGSVNARYEYKYEYLKLTPEQYEEYLKVIKMYPSLFNI